MIQKLHSSDALVVGAVQRPLAAWERVSLEPGAKNCVRAASASAAAEAAVEREARYHLHSTLQVKRDALLNLNDCCKAATQEHHSGEI